MVVLAADQSGCNGDSGGPVMYQHETNGRYSLIGKYTILMDLCRNIPTDSILPDNIPV